MRPIWEILQILQTDETNVLDCDECYLVLEYLADLASEGADQYFLKESMRNYARHCPHCDLHIERRINAIEDHLFVPAEIQRVGSPR